MLVGLYCDFKLTLLGRSFLSGTNIELTLGLKLSILERPITESWTISSALFRLCMGAAGFRYWLLPIVG